MKKCVWSSKEKSKAKKYDFNLLEKSHFPTDFNKNNNARRINGGLSIVLQLKDPLELFVTSREFLSGSRFLSRRDMT